MQNVEKYNSGVMKNIETYSKMKQVEDYYWN